VSTSQYGEQRSLAYGCQPADDMLARALVAGLHAWEVLIPQEISVLGLMTHRGTKPRTCRLRQFRLMPVNWAGAPSSCCWIWSAGKPLYRLIKRVLLFPRS